MFSFKKIMIVMLAAVILGGGMISMSMHAMGNQAFQQALLQRNQEKQRKQLFTCFGMSVLLSITAFTATSALMHGAYTKMLLDEQSPQRLNKIYGEFGATAVLAALAALGGTMAYYFAKFRDQEDGR